MYVIIEDGGRQYKVEEGQLLDVDFRDVRKGENITFETVLAVSGGIEVKIGQPEVPGASVAAEVLGPRLGKKIVVQKFRRRKNSRSKSGHRQMFTQVRIGKIDVG